MLTEKHPERVSKLVYLDAVYDPGGMWEVLKNSPVNDIQPPDEKTDFSSAEEYIEYIKYLRPDLAQIWNEIIDEMVVLDLEKTVEGKFIVKDDSAVVRELLARAITYDPQHTNIKVPVLRFEAQGDPIRPSYFTKEGGR